VRIFRLPLIVLFSMLLDVVTPPVVDSTEVLDQWEEALHRPRHNMAVSRIAALFPSAKLQRTGDSADTKTHARVWLRPQFLRAFQPVRKITRLAADPPSSPEDH